MRSSLSNAPESPEILPPPDPEITRETLQELGGFATQHLAPELHETETFHQTENSSLGKLIRAVRREL